MSSEARHNYPEGYKEKPWCPNTKLVLIGASLAGIELTPETFCTETIENAQYSEGVFDWLKKADFYPAASCSKINRELIQQLEIVKKVIEEPSAETVNSKILKAKSLSSKIKIVKAYEDAQNEFNRRETIVQRWRKVIFETSVSTTADGENVHFRQFKSADQLSEDEIIIKVKQFQSGLAKIVGFGENTVGWLIGEVKNCPQAFKHHHYGPLED